MAGISLHHALMQSIERLRQALLPDPFDPTGSYIRPEDVHLRAAAFRVLAHAELEAFVEDLAKGLFQTAWSAWTTHNLPSRVLLGLLAFSGQNHQAPPGSLKEQGGEFEISPILERSKNAWYYYFNNNNGLKEKNILRLLLPLGVSAADIDPTLLLDLSSYGSARGEVAHTSSLKVKSFIDPETEYRFTLRLAGGLIQLSNLVESHSQNVRALFGAKEGGPSESATPSRELEHQGVPHPKGSPSLENGSSSTVVRPDSAA